MERFYRFLSGLFLLILSVSGLIFVIKWSTPRNFILDYLQSLDGNNRFIAIIVFVIFAIIALLLIFVRSKKNVRESNLKEIMKNESGNVNISLPVLESIVLRLAGEFEPIRDAKVLLKSLPDGIAILVKTAMLSNVNIPEITEKMQNRIIEYFAENIQVAVKEIKIVVVREIGEIKPRVE